MEWRDWRGLGAAGLALLVALSAHAQGSGPTKNTFTHPCAFDSGAGRSVRCADAGAVTSWIVHVDNPLGTTTTFGLRDPAMTPGGCATFACPVTLNVNGMPVAMPPGSSCDPATGFVIGSFDVPGFGYFDVTFQTTLSGALTPGDTCANLATVVYPWGDVPAAEPMFDCRVDAGGGVYPTILTICGGATGTPDLDLVKVAETPAGQPLTAIEDGAQVCYRMVASNSGTGPATVAVVDTFDSHLSGLAVDPSNGFATGTCFWSDNQMTCSGVVLAPGVTDDARVCGTFTCTNGQVDLCNVAALVVQDPPTGDMVSSQPACVTVLSPDFSTSTKTATLLDSNGNGCLDQGDTVAFHITAINTGSPARDVFFSDPDPPEGTYAGDCSWSIGSGPAVPCPSPPAAGWALGPMIALETRIDWSVTLTSPIPTGTWCDQGGLLLATECAASRVMPDTCLPGCAPGPDVGSSILCDPAALFPGEETAVTLLLCNQGASPATSVVVTNPIQPCSSLVPNSLAYSIRGGGSGTLTDALDGDGGSAATGPDAVTFDVQAILGRALQPGECVDLSFRLVALTCADPGYIDKATITADGMTPRDSSGCFVQVLRPQAVPTLWKIATPDPEVGPGDLITYTLEACNDDTASSDLLNVVVSDDVPACTDYEPGTLRIDGRLMSDAPGDDAAEFVAPGPPNAGVTFRVSRLAPGECAMLTWQARAHMTCGGTQVTNRAQISADGGLGPLASNETVTAIATYTLVKTGGDVDGGRLVPGDQIEYSIRFCSGSPNQLLQVDVTDFIPTGGDCPVTYVPESMRIQVDGQAETALTDGILDDLGHFEPGPPAFIEAIASPLTPNTCFTLRFRVLLDAGCVPGDCVANTAHAQFTAPLQEMDSNLAVTCVGAAMSDELLRDVGRSSLIATGGCQFGQRLAEFACSEIPGLCREDVPGIRWTMLRDAATDGRFDVTFYEMPGSGCCVAAPPDGAYLTVRKSPGTTDVIVEIVPGCP